MLKKRKSKKSLESLAEAKLVAGSCVVAGSCTQLSLTCIWYQMRQPLENCFDRVAHLFASPLPAQLANPPRSRSHDRLSTRKIQTAFAVRVRASEIKRIRPIAKVKEKKTEGIICTDVFAT